jgi:hypothetical protein
MSFLKGAGCGLVMLLAFLGGTCAYGYQSSVCGSGVSEVQYYCCNVALSEEGGDSTVAFYPNPCGEGGTGRAQGSCSRWTNFMESTGGMTSDWQTIRPHPLGCSYNDEVQALLGP